MCVGVCGSFCSKEGVVRHSSLGQSLTFFTHSGIFDLTELRVVETTSRSRRDFRRVVDSRHRLRREGYSCVSFSLNSFSLELQTACRSQTEFLVEGSMEVPDGEILHPRPLFALPPICRSSRRYSLQSCPAGMIEESDRISANREQRC